METSRWRNAVAVRACPGACEPIRRSRSPACTRQRPARPAVGADGRPRPRRGGQPLLWISRDGPWGRHQTHAVPCFTVSAWCGGDASGSVPDPPRESGGSPTPTGWVEPRNAAQLALGASRRGSVQAITTGPGVSSTIIRLSGDIDVHRVSHQRIGKGRVLPPLADDLPVRRQLLGSIFALAVLPLLRLGWSFQRSGLNLTSDVLLFLLAVVMVAMVGGSWPSPRLPAASSTSPRPCPDLPAACSAANRSCLSCAIG